MNTLNPQNSEMWVVKWLIQSFILCKLKVVYAECYDCNITSVNVVITVFMNTVTIAQFEGILILQLQARLSY